jgi:hypothetical protein
VVAGAPRGYRVKDFGYEGGVEVIESKDWIFYI